MLNRQLHYLTGWLLIGLMLVGAVIYFSLAPVPPQLQLEFQFADKLEHMLSYGILMFWFAQLLTQNAARHTVAILLVLLGIALEFLQGMTGYRLFDLFDMGANTLGVLIGLYLSTQRYKNCFLTIEQQLLRK